MQLLVLESINDDPVIKGIGTVTTVSKTASSTAELRLNRTTTNGLERQNTLEHANSNNSVATVNSVTRLTPNATNDGDARSMYPFRVKHLGRTETYTLYAPTAQNRQDWCDKILEAKTRHAASLFEQNAEPFRLRVMADSAFAYMSPTSQRSVVSVKGTPLDRAIREMEQTYGAGPRPGPICRAQVNCATAFNCFGKSMVAVGTDYGVYTSEATNPRGWFRVGETMLTLCSGLIISGYTNVPCYPNIGPRGVLAMFDHCRQSINSLPPRCHSTHLELSSTSRQRPKSTTKAIWSKRRFLLRYSSHERSNSRFLQEA